MMSGKLKFALIWFGAIGLVLACVGATVSAHSRASECKPPAVRAAPVPGVWEPGCAQSDDRS